MKVERSEAHVAISTMLLVTRNHIDRNRQIHQVNTWLQGWCKQKKKIVFFYHGMIYSTSALLTPEEMHLSQRGKRARAQEPAGLIDRTLNQLGSGKGTKPGSPAGSDGMVCQNLRTSTNGIPPSPSDLLAAKHHT